MYQSTGMVCSKLIKSNSQQQRLPSIALEEDIQETETFSYGEKAANSQDRADLRIPEKTMLGE